MLSLKGRINYRGREPEIGNRNTAARLVTSDPCLPSSEWCPHCGGPLKREPRLFQHPCFDDSSWAIRRTEDGERATDAGSPSVVADLPPAVIRLQPGTWRVLCALRAAFGHFVSRDYLLAQLQPRRGEAADPKIVAVHLCHLRRALHGTPFVIESRRGTGCWRLIQRSESRNQKAESTPRSEAAPIRAS
jgi:hypothetical protein